MSDSHSNIISGTPKGEIEQRELLTELEAARYIGMSRSFLAKDRMNGLRYGITQGPKFIRAGKKSIRYPKTELDNWINQNIVERTLPD